MKQMCSRKRVIKLLELKTENTFVAHANLFTLGKTEKVKTFFVSKAHISSYLARGVNSK